MFEGGLSPRKPRTRGTNSKTGCSTCRTRHLKCDESKPACLRCSKSGLVCEGYLLIASNISLGPVRSKKEQRYFDLFQHSTIEGLMGFNCGSTFWSYIVLQLSQSSRAVLHGTLALSSLHEHVNGDSTANSNAGNYRISLQQYNKSIGYLRSQQASQPLQITLTCCILFICFENAQGNHETALEHLRNGLNILRDWNAQGSTSSSEDLMKKNLTQVFRRLDMQATVFMDSRQPELNATLTSNDISTDDWALKTFSTMQDAQCALENIEIRLFYVLTSKSAHHHSCQGYDDMLSSRNALLRGLRGQFIRWKEAFDSFSLRKGERLQMKDVQLGVLLGIHFETTSLMLEMKSQLSPDIQNIFQWEARFVRINDLSRSLINASSTQNKFAFSADTGVIAPLYYSAMNATSPPVRQQAIQILRLLQRKEGFWNAATAASIAEKVSMVKRAGTSGLPVTGGIPVLANAHSVAYI